MGEQLRCFNQQNGFTKLDYKIKLLLYFNHVSRISVFMFSPYSPVNSINYCKQMCSYLCSMSFIFGTPVISIPKHLFLWLCIVSMILLTDCWVLNFSLKGDLVRWHGTGCCFVLWGWRSQSFIYYHQIL